MARRAFVWLTFLALVLAFGAAVPSPAPDNDSATSLAQEIEQSINGHAVVLANGPLDGGNAAAATSQWNDNDDPDDILQAESISIAFPPLTSGFGRRVGHAVVRASLVAAAFPRGPPIL